MSRKRGPAPKAVSNGPKWYGFVRCDFDADSKRRFDAWQAETPINDTWAWFLEMVDRFKITFSWSDQQSCYMVAMTGTVDSEPMYFGWTLTARARDVERSLEALRYKHQVILDESWLHQVIEETKPEDWVG